MRMLSKFLMEFIGKMQIKMFLIHISSPTSHLEVDLLPWHHASSHSGLSVTPIEMDCTLLSDISRDHIVCYLSPRYLHCIPIFCNWIPKKCDVSHNPQWTHQLILQSPYFSHHHPPHHIPSPSPSPSTKNFILYIYPIIHHDYTIIQLLVAWHIIFIHVFCLILEAIFSHHAPTLLISC